MTFRSEFDHHDELRAAALEEFCERGYDAASINRILTAAGVSKGQLYHHFDNKEGLYLGLVEWMIDAKVAWFLANHFDLSPDPIASLGEQVRAAIDFAVTHPDIDRFTRSLLSERGRPIFAAVVDRFGFDPDGVLGALVEQGRREGTIRTDLDADLLRRIIALVVNHLPDLLDLHGPTELTGRLDELLQILRDILTPR